MRRASRSRQQRSRAAAPGRERRRQITAKMFEHGPPMYSPTRTQKFRKECRSATFVQKRCGYYARNGIHSTTVRRRPQWGARIVCVRRRLPRVAVAGRSNGRIGARPRADAARHQVPDPGRLASAVRVTRSFSCPQSSPPPLPLLVLLHGAGGSAAGHPPPSRSCGRRSGGRRPCAGFARLDVGRHRRRSRSGRYLPESQPRARLRDDVGRSRPGVGRRILRRRDLCVDTRTPQRRSVSSRRRFFTRLRRSGRPAGQGNVLSVARHPRRDPAHRPLQPADRSGASEGWIRRDLSGNSTVATPSLRRSRKRACDGLLKLTPNFQLQLPSR